MIFDRLCLVRRGWLKMTSGTQSMDLQKLVGVSSIKEDMPAIGDCDEKKAQGGEVNGEAPSMNDAPKRKVGLLLAFCGKKYYGLQLNRGDTTLPTIEGALFEALVKANAVAEICQEKSQQMKYASSSRTDKGVSTCGLVVSLKVRLKENTADLINSHLPQDIRVLDVKRATKSFHAKNNANARTYSYTMPTFAFASKEEADESYRITEDKLKHIQSVLYRYKGTHSFHNFTSGKRMGESSAKRYIMNFWNEPPFVHESIEFVTLKVKGQSFMIHQIRKMVGLLIVMVNGCASEEHYVRAFSEPLEDIPKAPGTGLILEQVHYDAYNKKHGHLHGGMDWSSSADKAKEFMMKHILPVLYKEEIENKSMKTWLEGLSNHDFTGIKAKEQWNQQLIDQQKKVDAQGRAVTKEDGIEGNVPEHEDLEPRNGQTQAKEFSRTHDEPPVKKAKVADT